MATLDINLPSQRLMSLDAFRGFTIAGMILVNNPGSWSYVYPQLAHAKWNGWTFTDLIFPFFLFIVGVAMTFSYSKRVERGDDKTKLLLHALRRAAIIFGLGIFLNGFPQLMPYLNFSALDTIRIPGVLQRIGICYLIASMIFLNSGIKGQTIWTGVLLVIYWLLMKLVPVPGYGASVLEPTGNLCWYIDSTLLHGHTWSGAPVPGFDPEGIVSTIPAIATTLFGILTGHLLRTNKTQQEKTAWMFVLGNALLFAGLVMDNWLPINKNLWTSSYAVFMGGMALQFLAMFYWLIDVKGYKRWTAPFVIYGMNSIAVFFLSSLSARILTLIKVTGADGAAVALKTYLYQNVFAALAGPLNGSLLFALAYVLLWLGLMGILYRMKVFIKI